MKRILSKIIVLFILLCLILPISGCWDYTEMHDIKFASGMAIDKDKFTNEYLCTIEVLKSSSDGKSVKSTVIQSRGPTIHTALRDAVSSTGKQLQASHMKVVIVSKDIATEGIVPVIDLINRDIEARNDMWILISQMNTASEIFTKGKKEEGIMSYELADTIVNYNKTGKYIATQIFKLIDDLSTDSISPTIPMIKIDTKDHKPTIKVSGTAMFKDDKMIGQLDENETLLLQLLKEQEIEFIIPILIENNKNISLEIMNMDRKIEPKIQENKISMNIYLNINVGLSELPETVEYNISKKEISKLEDQSEKYIENTLYNLIEKLQKQYKSDVIGLGKVLKKKKPNEWKRVSNNWNKIFQDMPINLFTNINIKYSGTTNKNIKIGD